MKEIYFIIGKLINSFQILENHLKLLLHDFYCQKENPNDIMQSLSKIDKNTLGKNLLTIKKCAIFESEHDISLLKFLNDKRNYIVHHFFAENDFSNQSEIELHKQSLRQLFNNVEMINKALFHIISNDSK